MSYRASVILEKAQYIGMLLFLALMIAVLETMADRMQLIQTVAHTYDVHETQVKLPKLVLWDHIWRNSLGGLLISSAALHLITGGWFFKWVCQPIPPRGWEYAPGHSENPVFEEYNRTLRGHWT